MKCDEEKLAAHVFGDLDEAQSRALEAHVQACPSCAARLARLRDTAAVLEAVPRAVNEPVDLDRLRAAIAVRTDERPRPVDARRKPSPRWRWCVGLAAAAGLAVLCFQYGVAVRVGSVELALGGAKSPAPSPRETSPFDRTDPTVIRTVAHEEVVAAVGPSLKALAQYVGDLETRYRREFLVLRNEFSSQRAWDHDQVTRNIQLIASGMEDALRERPLAVVAKRPVGPSTGKE